MPNRGYEEQARAEYQDRQFECFRENGVEVDESGEQPEILASGDQLTDVIATCEAILGPVPAPAPLTDDEVVDIYQQSLDSMACLEDLGYAVADPPSLEEYLDSYRIANGGPPTWFPYDGINDASAFELCPQPSL